MPETSPPANPPTAVGTEAMRIVLFGMPDAGKSSLLGALAQAAQTQEHLLNGHLTDVSKGLAELQQRLYEERPRGTLEEVIPYAVTFEPFAPGGNGRTKPQNAILVDCDGRVANDLLTRRKSLDADSAEGSLAAQIMDADTLVLVVDAAASPVQTDADFAEFGRFLRLLEQRRGRRTEVGGLPVFLVLTKCDLLAESNDTPAVWMERIEERKRQVDRRFQAFLARQREEGPLPFGSIDLNLWATAVKRPALAGSPARPREPYGVAELFRQCFDEAAAFRARRQRSGRRLVWTVAGAGSVVAAMAALATALVVHHDTSPPVALENRLTEYRSAEGHTASSRLREGRLEERIGELTGLADSPDFVRLRPEEQAYVRQRLQELKDYRSYLRKVREARPPGEARTLRELAEIEARLINDLNVPAEYRGEWGATEAALLRDRRLEDTKSLRAAVTDLERQYQSLTERARELTTFTDLQALLDDADRLKYRPTDRLPGSDTLNYDAVFRFDEVSQARSEWTAARQRLDGVRDLATALGVGGAQAGRPALLRIPPPSGFTVDQAGERLQALDKAYPSYRQWSLPADLAPGIAAELRRALEVSYDNLVKAGRDAVLRQFQRISTDGKETPERWKQVRDWLAANEPLRDWDRLALIVVRLLDPKADDPVPALVTFLGQDRFELELRGLSLHVPDDLKKRPVGRLAVYHRSGDETKPTLSFRILGEGRRDPRRRVTTYTLVPEGGTALTYRPGDLLWAELPLKDTADNRDWLFTWSVCRSLVYQFERLVRPPRLHLKGQEATAGEVADGVGLTIQPERGVPRVPDLLPVVRLEKR
jgi:hypothetical protein